MKLSSVGLLVLTTLLAFGPPAHGRTLTINSNASDPAPRAAWEWAVEKFQEEHPQIEVKFNLYDHESYKNALRNWLSGSPPDVVFWFVGNRMREFVGLGLLEDVSDLFSPRVRRELREAAIDFVSVGGGQYGVPYAYYHWGIYFRRDLFERVGLDRPPQSWPELLAACDRFRAAGIAPFALGSKELWPTAGWFDYINLRLNGRAFHMQLMSGRVSYTDARVVAIFTKWREAIERGCFVSSHAGMSWQESQVLLYQGRAAMMLIGNFIVPNFPPEVRDRMDFARFPDIDPGVGRYEEAPMNSIHIPARAANKDAARLFLAFVLRADVQERLNRVLLQIPANASAAVVEDRFLQAGQALLAGADGLTQFFDRDTREDLATIAMKGFQEFMVMPDRLDAVLATIERARMRIYGD